MHGVNVMGVVHGIQAFVPCMFDSREEGHSLDTSSGDGGIEPLPHQSVDAASRHPASVAAGRYWNVDG